MLLLLLFSLTITLQFQDKTLALPGPSCLKRCRDVEVQYPLEIMRGIAARMILCQASTSLRYFSQPLQANRTGFHTHCV